ncbi:alkaline phosphatase [Alienimonas sp. DA493]|uniref:alkaline phosphatase n=1 Tax=Alienimonas sp. DA493 TaxID=3373605 RepID=UPI0037540308
MPNRRPTPLLSILLLAGGTLAPAAAGADGERTGDVLRELQERAIEEGVSEAAHWGWKPETYTLWGTHTNRLIPVYTYGTAGAGEGVDLNDYVGANSVYRDGRKLITLYGRPPANTFNPQAEYLDQTNVYDLQRAALDAGKKHVFLVVFDGMDWQTTRAAAIYNTGRVPYASGRGTGAHFQDYDANGTSQFGFMVTSPHNDGTDVDVDAQRVLNPGGVLPGGYDPARAGAAPWTPGEDLEYLVAGPKFSANRHAYTDSAASAVSMTAGIKTYNNAINVDPEGRRVRTIAHQAQEEGLAVGAVSSVPISHATPAAAYAHNVHRNDYQDLTRDLLGRPSISHPDRPLPGLDVLVGGGYGADREKDSGQGENYVPGNSYLAAEDLRAVDVAHGGRYVVAHRTPGVNGPERLAEAAAEAAAGGKRLFGFYGTKAGKGHLPFRTADGGYDPTVGRSKTAEKYSPADLAENPTLADMTRAALTVLETDPDGFWLLVEAGDVDWANHDNNLDNAIGAVNSGDEAVKVVTDWVERNSNWEESLMIVTADHGHYLVLDRPELLAPQSGAAEAAAAE